jgi:hypothetical protein
MPGEGIKTQGADFTLPSGKIADKITVLVQKYTDDQMSIRQ